ncbi:hypothetical protein [Clostridium sp. HBUAS56010]|uniref:hypothetical protein n=1 Tax=Clostridium sp. HBUAS56010 TaxID=2571127 RepID=UPI0011784CCF|nr:hypothetical protein [Clostridium sp. HBUAS56010]
MSKEIVKIAVDAYRGKQHGNYSTSDSMEVLKKALIEANNGKTSLDYRDIRDGKCSGLFSIMEEIITKTVLEGLPESSPIFQFVDFRNKALGDQDSFNIKETGLFTVADIAEGTQGIRRQRVVGGETVYVTPQIKAIKIYEELNLLLADRIDMNELIDRVGRSFIVKTNTDIYTAFAGTYSKLVAPYQVSGTFSEDKLATLIDHVEAATGLTAYVLGSKQAVRKIAGIKGADANSAKEDLYNVGYYGKFGVNPIIAMQNGHKPGTTNFILNDTDLHVVAGDDKFIKHVTEGDTLIIPGNPMSNADLSQDFLMAQRNNTGIVMSEVFGCYRLG